MFWTPLADQRRLEGMKKILVTEAELLERWENASGYPMTTATMESVGMIEREGDLWRVRGMSRYIEMEEKRVVAVVQALAREATKRETGQRGTAKATETARSDQGGTSLVPAHVQRLETRDVRRETVEEKQKTDLPKPKAQPELPGIPAKERKRSLGEKLYTYFGNARASRFQQLGVEFKADPLVDVVVINTWAAHWLPAALRTGLQLSPDDPVDLPTLGLDEAGALVIASEALVHWLETSTWGAKCDPPWPFNAYCSRKTWEPALAEWAKSIGNPRRTG